VDLPTLSFRTPAEWETWLLANHSRSPGIWMRIATKDSGTASPSYGEALDVALCYGWIDGQKAAGDGASWLQRFTPRRPRSRWSKTNCAKAEALIAAGRMAPPGLAEVERARQDGRWAAAYDGPASAGVPGDLERALRANPAAASYFSTLDGRNRYAILFRIQEAKRPETRARRIEKFVDMLARGEKIHE
jgi:uncharacterized protein YdeI (YjbR/CyaY-like superfamily)